jgi:putative SOS response-associated peptidase YedK
MTNCRYYEWLKKGTQRIPHFMRHEDRRLMLFAGLYDSATLKGEHRTAQVSHRA